MKIIIPSTPPGGLNATGEPRFGRSSFFNIVHLADGAIKEVHVEILPLSPLSQGNAIAIADFIRRSEASVFLVGYMGLNAYSHLEAVSDLKLYQIPWDRLYSVKELLGLFLQEMLPEISKKSIMDGQGRPGAGRGRGGGRGSGQGRGGGGGRHRHGHGGGRP